MIKENFSKQQARRRALIKALGWTALVSGWGTAGGALAQVYPVRPIRSLVPFGPGGLSDIAARLLAERLSKSLQQPFIVDNRPGAGGIIATEIVVKAEPDGYTLLWFGSSAAVSVSLMKSLPYDLVRDLVPVSTTGFAALALLVTADSPIRSVTDLVASAKANPAKFNIGIPLIGTMQHVSAEMFISMAGLTTQVVPYRTTSAVIGAVRANEAQGMFEFIAPVLPHIKSGALRALAVTSAGRFAALADVPTMAEAGFPGYESSAWAALAAPAKTPRIIINRLNREVNAVVALPDVKQRLQELGIDARGSTLQGTLELLIADIAKWKTVIEKANIPRQ